MMANHTREELNKLSKQDLVKITLSLQEQLNRTNANLENLIEQIRISNQQRYGRKTEKSNIGTVYL